MVYFLISSRQLRFRLLRPSDELKLNDSILRARALACTHTHTISGDAVVFFGLPHLGDETNWKCGKRDSFRAHMNCETNLLQTICVMESLVNYTGRHYLRAYFSRLVLCELRHRPSASAVIMYSAFDAFSDKLNRD